MLSIVKTLSFSLVVEALTGLINHCPAGENSSFHFKAFVKKANEVNINVKMSTINLTLGEKPTRFDPQAA